MARSGPPGHVGAVFPGVFDPAGDPVAGLMRMRIKPPFGRSISNEFVFRTRSLSFRKPKVLGSKSEARLESRPPTSPSGTQPSSLSICAITFLMMGTAALAGCRGPAVGTASLLLAVPFSRFPV